MIDSNTPKVQVLVGMIGSYKSTYAQIRAEQGAVTVSDDLIVQACHAGDYTLYDKSLKSVYKAVENVIFNNALALGRDIIVDRGVNISEKSRRRWIGLASSLDIDIIGIEFPRFTPEVHAMRRYKSDSRGIEYDQWLKVAEAHAARYQSPLLQEGFSEIYSAEFIDGKFELLRKY